MRRYGFIVLLYGSIVSAMDSSGQDPFAPVKSELENSTPSFTVQGDWDALDNGIEAVGAVDDRRGNWYEKKKIFYKARSVRQDILRDIAQVDSLQTVFEDNHQKCMGIIEQCFVSNGFEYNFLLQRIVLLIQRADEQKQSTQATTKNRELLIALEEKKHELEKLQQEVQGLQVYADQNNEVFQRFQDQIQQIDSYKGQLDELFEKIAQTRNDEIAAQFLLDMQTLGDNTKNTYQYLQGDLINFYGVLEKSMVEVVTMITTHIKTLVERKILTKVDEPPAKPVPVPVEKKPEGFIETIVSYGQRFVSWIGSYFHS